MHVMVHEYANGGHTAYETSDDGGTYLRDCDGERKVGEPICAFIDAACYSTDQDIDRLLESMSWLIEEIKKRGSEALAQQGSAANVPG